MRRAAALLALLLPVTAAHANELWSCNVTSGPNDKPLLVTFEVRDNKLIQKWLSGSASDYDIAQNNDYGIVALSSISALEPGHSKPTVGARVVAISKTTKEVWLGAVPVGSSAEKNQPAHGPCIVTP